MSTSTWKSQPQVAIALNDTRTLAVCLVRPAEALFYNWTTTGWEAPFVPAAHLELLQPMVPAPPLFSGVRYLDIGDALLQRSDVAALLVSIDASGNPMAVVDCWTLPT